MIHCLIMNAADYQIKNEQKRFGDYLGTSRVKFTRGRQTVFEEAMKAHGHFAAEDLVKQCQKHKRKVSRATIYRSLIEMLEAGILRKTAFGEKHQHFEHIYDEKPHHHARCLRCHSIFEFPDKKEDNLYQPILRKMGFHVLGHEMHFYGICQKCSKRKNEQHTIIHGK